MSETHNSAAAERVSDLTKSSYERKSNNEDVITVAAADFNYHSFPSLPSSRPLLRVPWEGRGTAFLLPIDYHTPTHEMWNFVVAMHPLTKTKLWGGTPPLKQESWITVTFGQGKKGIDSFLPWQKLRFLFLRNCLISNLCHRRRVRLVYEISHCVHWGMVGYVAALFPPLHKDNGMRKTVFRGLDTTSAGTWSLKLIKQNCQTWK